MSVVFDPVHATQRTFRALLAAMSHPGRITAIDDTIDAPAGLGGALAAAALTLFDREVSVWLAPADREAGNWLVRHTGCRIVSDSQAAHFAVILEADDMLPVSRWNSGTPEDPETSTTLLVRAQALSGGAPVLLRGPGIVDHIPLAIRGLPDGVWRAWEENAAGYPLGADALFFDERSTIGVPRTSVPVRA